MSDVLDRIQEEINKTVIIHLNEKLQSFDLSPEKMFTLKVLAVDIINRCVIEAAAKARGSHTALSQSFVHYGRALELATKFFQLVDVEKLEKLLRQANVPKPQKKKRK